MKINSAIYLMILCFLLGLMIGDAAFGEGKWVTRISYLFVGLAFGRMLFDSSGKKREPVINQGEKQP
jgi:uncharacterized membrane protein YuzA (DUF378 family)